MLSFLYELDISLILTCFTRMLFKDIYKPTYYTNFHRFYLSPIVMKLRFVSFLLNEYRIG